ncbi:flagellar protein FlhE [Erwinia amylovora]|uniref:Flagellar protein FlhE n=3 Tax=Erwinia amylovora TaxID=552 RepID=A0A831A256_ERWAM|nr:flagellar protein FlhE [Erwinia amylovora]CDK15531.1 Flagellar protein FlhE precursor [Erwinia amylovora LA635]CDK18898.1 Flagellar protein FlhE precursor [Erwinia amylovora LA636]CDK22268.1 Flagellar protein FlhE precursor [Erwinia amylovora LA637]ATZ11824.1 flagellar protein FlhE [Erwinia amylovora]EKV54787.1 Flagellar protein FlhE precursor [Erwinia amylovora ACW56400]
MKAVLWLLFSFPVVAIASDGGWQASATGPALANRGVAASSRPLIPPAGVAGVMTDVAWRYTLNSPAPAGLQVRLCAADRCVTVEGGSGITRGLTNVAAGETLRFVFQVEGKGRVFPPLRVVSNEVMVNYH